ncbi:MAG: cation transporter [Candidatus Kapabacteria bacterium]|nr:cation transporter [Candidatus Kapabacteria bacterium]
MNILFRFLCALALTLGVAVSASAQSAPVWKDTSFTVSGNCGMCKKTIEKPFKSMSGIEKATWDKKTKLFTVRYDASITSVPAIKKIIAGVGYDTDEVKASDETYATLPKCCRYRDGSHD